MSTVKTQNDTLMHMLSHPFVALFDFRTTINVKGIVEQDFLNKVGLEFTSSLSHLEA